jgi:hypothetical protein
MSGREYALFIAVALLWGCALTVPSDEHLIRHFHEHESEFVEIVGMLRMDTGVTRLSFDSVSPDGAIDDERWEAYKHIMKKAGVRSVYAFGKEHPRLPEFEFHTRAGDYNLEYQKNYAFSIRAPAPIVEDLDAAMDTIPSYGVSYRHIGGNWYISLQKLTE